MKSSIVEIKKKFEWNNDNSNFLNLRYINIYESDY